MSKFTLNLLGDISFQYQCKIYRNLYKKNNKYWYLFNTFYIRTYQIAKNVVIYKENNEYLGLTIAGGNDGGKFSNIASSFNVFASLVISHAESSL